ncbi:MAG: Crotonobetainyl-CoA:carnitine CoA-transferase CaiB [Chloroflexi bacterium]|nr:MAG: Crotonobetainyl-CoA:carnitine CoA-transferase CaiB [Chloroflexota bacterium]
MPSKYFEDDLPLDGIRIVETAQGVSGPYAAKLLGSLGAEIIKVELPDGDWSRKVPPFLSETNRIESSALYLYNNTGKKSVVIDWRNSEGLQHLKNLIKSADLLIEDWDRSARTKWNLNSEMFLEDNPQLIELCITPFGLYGPYSNYKSSPLIQLALGGILNLVGYPEQEPLMLPGNQPDYLTGINGSNSIQIALWDKDFFGESGKFLELTMMETLANLHQAPLDMGGVIRQRSGHRQSPLSSNGFPPGICTVSAKDGYMTFGGGSPVIWEQLCLMLGRLDLLEDGSFDNVFENPESGLIVDQIMESWMAEKTREEVFEEASSIWMLPVSPVKKINEILEDKQYASRHAFQKITHPVAGEATYPSPTFTANGEKLEVSRSPMLGEHTKEYLW